MGGCLPSKLTPEVIEDLKELTEFSANEIREWYRIFRHDFPSGHIDVHELKRIYGETYPDGDATKFSEHVFRAFEKNEEGKIDFIKFICCVSIMNMGTLEEKLKRAFTIYDIDGDGFVSREEMCEILHAVYKMRGTNKGMPEGESTPWSATGKVFSELDKDNTGVLSLEQFVEGAKKDPDLQQIFQCHYRGPESDVSGRNKKTTKK